MRELDAKKSEQEYAASKFPEHYEWIDIEARNTFHEGVGAGILKCIIRYNHHGKRN